MKRKFLIMFMMVVFLFMKDGVNASSFNLDTWTQDDIYFVMRDYNGFYLSMSFPFYSMDGVVVYCIEPGASVNTSIYDGEEGFNLSPFSDEVNNMINLIGYYGYNYTSHDTVRFRMATQALIWEYTGNKIIEFYTKQYGYGEYIDVSYEKDIIMDLVNNHYDKPSFDEEIVEARVGDVIVLEDYNGVLGKLDVLDDGGNEVTIVDNMLYIKVKSFDNSRILFGSYRYDDEDTVIFIGKGIDSQMMGKFRLRYEVHSFVDVFGKGKKIRIKKVDMEDNSEIRLSGIGFKIYDVDNKEYICESSDCIFYTNDDGEVSTRGYYNGNYEIMESLDSEVFGYVINDDVIYLDTDSCDDYCEVLFPNKRVKGRVIINKYGEEFTINNNNIYYSTIGLGDVRFDLYSYDVNNKSDSLISSFVTSFDGKVDIDNLEMGKYYLREVSSSLGNMVEDDVIYFEIEYNGKYDDEIVKDINIYNYLPKGKITVIKNDDDGNRIEGALIDLYYKYNDDYVLVGEEYTDSDGVIIWDNMPLGEYYVYEKMSALGYVNEYERVDLKIGNNMDDKVVIIENKKYIEVVNTWKIDSEGYVYVGIFNILFSMGMFLIAKRIF